MSDPSICTEARVIDLDGEPAAFARVIRTGNLKNGALQKRRWGLVLGVAGHIRSK